MINKGVGQKESNVVELESVVEIFEITLCVVDVVSCF